MSWEIHTSENICEFVLNFCVLMFPVLFGGVESLLMNLIHRKHSERKCVYCD